MGNARVDDQHEHDLLEDQGQPGLTAARQPSGGGRDSQIRTRDVLAPPKGGCLTGNSYDCRFGMYFRQLSVLSDICANVLQLSAAWPTRSAAVNPLRVR